MSDEAETYWTEGDSCHQFWLGDWCIGTVVAPPPSAAGRKVGYAWNLNYPGKRPEGGTALTLGEAKGALRSAFEALGVSSPP